MPPKAASRGEYIETETGNKISRRATILGPKHIVLAGKCVIQQDVVVHGDLVRPAQPKAQQQQQQQQEQQKSVVNQEQTSIHLGRYVFVSPGCTLHPPSRLASSSSSSSTDTSAGSGATTTTTTALTYYPLRISDYVYIGPNTQIRAAEIRSNVYIGANCVIGNMCIIKDNVKILDGTVLPANSVWASNSIIAGKPARVVGELGEGWGSTGTSGSSGVEEGIGVRSRERWAVVGNKR